MIKCEQNMDFKGGNTVIKKSWLNFNTTLGDVHLITCSSDGQIAVVQDDQIRIFDIETCIEIMNFHTGCDYYQMTAIQYSADGEIIVSGFEKGSLEIWNASDGKSLFKQDIPNSDPVRKIFISNDRQFITTLSVEGLLLIIDTKDTNKIFMIKHIRDAYGFYRDYGFILSDDYTNLKIQTLQTTKSISYQMDNKKYIYSCISSSISQLIGTLTDDNVIRIYDIRKGKMIFNLKRAILDCWTKLCSFNSSFLVFATQEQDKAIKIMNIANRIVENINEQQIKWKDITLSNDAKYVFLIDKDAQLRFYYNL